MAKRKLGRGLDTLIRRARGDRPAADLDSDNRPVTTGARGGGVATGARPRATSAVAEDSRPGPAVLEIRALAWEVVSARVRTEVESLLDEARSRQEGGNYLGSASPLAAARALLASNAMASLPEDPLNQEVDELARLAEVAGASVPLVHPSPAVPVDQKWLDAL